MRSLRTVIVGALGVAAVVATAMADEARIDTIVVTAKPVRPFVTEIEKVLPPNTVELSSPMPTDMPEAEVDYHMLLISVSPSAQVKS